MLDRHAPIRVDPQHPPVLLVVIDTEEEFEWSAEPDRSATSVRAIDRIGRVQEIFDEFGLVPTYVVDYPVASREEGYRPLREIADDGRATIGAHLHPWVNPPHDEPLTRSNMYPGNLPRPLEAAKLDALATEIERNFGRRPVVYKAGRYGVGGNSAAILEELGFEIDLSVCPPVDYGADGGPDFSQALCEPYWFGTGDRLLEVPLTGAYIGWAGPVSHAVYRIATRPAWSRFRLPGILARLGAVDRLMLSPEGFTATEHVRLTRALLSRGVRTFTWSFHSTAVLPGHTPYVKTEADLEFFLDLFREYFKFFFGTLGGIALTPQKLKQQLEAAR